MDTLKQEDIMKQTKYYEVEAVSNSFLNFIDSEGKGTKFNDRSYSQFIGTCVHALLAKELNPSDIYIIPDYTHRLKGKEKEVWLELFMGHTIEDAVKHHYKTTIEDRVKHIEEVYNEYILLLENATDYCITKQRTMWSNNPKMSDEQIYDVIMRAYRGMEDYVLAMLENDCKSMCEFEDEIYWVDDVTQLKCKAKPDLWYIKDYFDSVPVVVLNDFKIGEGEIYNKIRDRKYLRQLSFYSEAINKKYGYIVDEYNLLYYNLGSNKVEPISINKNDIYYARVGGYYTPEFFNQVDNIYCDDSQLGALSYFGMWKTPNQKYYIRGWRQLLEIVRQRGEFNHLIDYSKVVENLIEIEIPF